MKRKLLLGTLGVLTLAGVGVAAGRFLHAPVSTVVPGVIYRSGQPDSDDLRFATEKLGVKSVLNLRGPRAKRAWWEGDSQSTSRAEASRLQLQRADLRFEASAIPPREEVRELVRFLDSSPKPLLIHCQMGVDRSGWASAVARALRGEPIDDALDELSMVHGHFCTPSKCTLHRFFADYEAWLTEQHQNHSAANFRRWLDGYCPQPYDANLVAASPVAGTIDRGEELPLVVDVRNQARTAWQSAAVDHPIALGARFIGPFDTPQPDPLSVFRTPNGPAHDVWRAKASTPQAPGETRRIAFAVRVPEEPGIYYLQVDMVQEHVHWFSDLGRPGLVLPLVVR